MSTATAAPAVRAQVRKLLTSSAAYASLPPDRRRDIARDTVRVASRLLDPQGLSAQESADFPGFVSDLIHGVFGAIVDASIEQMKAYADLVATVAKSVDQFVEDNTSDDGERDSLANAYPDQFRTTGTQKTGSKLRSSASQQRLARHRQQLLATTVMMGINRIVVTDGKIRS
jgi:hypothetical protein